MPTRISMLPPAKRRRTSSPHANGGTSAASGPSLKGKVAFSRTPCAGEPVSDLIPTACQPHSYRMPQKGPYCLASKSHPATTAVAAARTVSPVQVTPLSTGETCRVTGMKIKSNSTLTGLLSITLAVRLRVQLPVMHAEETVSDLLCRPVGVRAGSAQVGTIGSDQRGSPSLSVPLLFPGLP